MTKPKAQRVPVELPHKVVCWLAGDPVILAASDEQAIRRQWAALLSKLRERK